jgi:cytosine/uracil/thiamine/allantoin permease
MENGFFKVAGWSAVALPSATVVMCVDQFVLPRLIRLRRPVDQIPSWRTAGVANWPAIVAVLAAVLFGAWGLQLFPGQTSAPSLGLVPVEAWAIAGVLYTGLAAAVARTRFAGVLLGLGRHLRGGPARHAAG